MKRLLRWVVRQFPRAFREQYAFEMVDYLDHEYDRARSRGWLPTFGFTLASMLDLACRPGGASNVDPIESLRSEILTEQPAVSSAVFERSGLAVACVMRSRLLTGERIVRVPGGDLASSGTTA